MKLLKDLIKDEGIKTVAELFTKHPERWAQGDGIAGGIDKDGKPLAFSSGPVVRCCIAYAIRIVHSELDWNARDKMGDKINDIVSGGNPGMASWNDKPGRTVEEVIEVARRAGV